MADNKLALLKQAVTITEIMLRHAEASEWSELSTHQEQRASLLTSIFPLPEDEQSESYRPLIMTMIELNQKLEMLCRQAQQTLQLELRGLNKNRKAVAAYQSS